MGKGEVPPSPRIRLIELFIFCGIEVELKINKYSIQFSFKAELIKFTLSRKTELKDSCPLIF